jgi:uncharacterized membrane protein
MQPDQAIKIGPLRRLLLLLLSIALVAGGLTLASREISVTEGHVFWRGLIVAGFLTALGGYLLWEDFIRPVLTRR